MESYPVFRLLSRKRIGKDWDNDYNPFLRKYINKENVGKP